MPPEQRCYSEEEGDQILRLAVSGSHGSTGMSREQLLATAAELGVTPEAFEQAENEFLLKREQEALRRQYETGVRAEFLSHVGVYGVLNLGMIGLDLVLAGRMTWSWFPLLIWGIFLLLDLVETFSRGADYEKGFEKWQEKRAAKRNRKRSLKSTTG